MNTLTKTTTIKNIEGLYYELSNKGVPAHFYGANGFPTLTYSPLLKGLSEHFALKSLLFRACWKSMANPSKPVVWKTYADDLIPFIENNYSEPIVGIGHSQGATTTIIAATLRPDLFKELILIEPASVSISIENLMKIIPLFIKKKLKPMNSTLNKKERWNNVEEYFQYLRKNNGYKRIDDKSLFDIAKNSLNASNQLIFQAKWEAYNYSFPINLNKYIKKLEVPTTIISGKPSLFLKKEIREKWKLLNPQINFVNNNNFGHLFPFENPNMILEEIKKVTSIKKATHFD